MKCQYAQNLTLPFVFFVFRWMKKPRCGVPDQMGGVSKLNVRKRRYALTGQKWQHKHITYRWVDSRICPTFFESKTVNGQIIPRLFNCFTFMGSKNVGFPELTCKNVCSERNRNSFFSYSIYNIISSGVLWSCNYLFQTGKCKECYFKVKVHYWKFDQCTPFRSNVHYTMHCWIYHFEDTYLEVVMVRNWKILTIR